MLQPSPSFPNHAQTLLQDGRAAVAQSDWKGGLALLRAAVMLDATVLCEPWGLAPHLEAQNRASIRTRMLDRLQSWHRKPFSQAHRHVSRLVEKTHMRNYVNDIGLPLPRILTKDIALADLNAVSLPDRFVLKPTNAGSSKGVIVAVDGCDQLQNGARIGPDLAAYARAVFAQDGIEGAPIMIEDCLLDIGHTQDTALVIPRDFKIFAVGGHVGYVRVHDRNAPDGRRSLISYDRNGRRLPPTLRGWPEPMADVAVPDHFASLIAMAEAISMRLPWLLRFDFFLTPTGPVFGEITTFPNAGLDLTPFSRRTMWQMWEVWPDDALSPGVSME